MPGTSTDRIDNVNSWAAIKIPVKAATTANITLSGQQTINAVSCEDGDRVLVKNQSDATENGVWVVSTTDWTRAKDFDGKRDAVEGTLVYVKGGSNSGFWTCTTIDPITIGSDSITFERTTDSGIANITSYSATLLADATAAAWRTDLDVYSVAEVDALAAPASLELTPIAGDTTLVAGDFPAHYVTTATCVLTLPAANSVDAGSTLEFKSATTGSVQIAPAGADTIDFQAGNQRVPSYDTWKLVSDGASNWYVTLRPQHNVGDFKHSANTVAGPGWVTPGSNLDRLTYAGLFAVVGTTWGVGDGSTTFGTPPAPGRTLVSVGTPIALDSGGAGLISTGSDTFTVSSNKDRWITGMPVVLTFTGGTITHSTGTLTSGVTYYIIRTTTTTVKLASSLANAQNGTAFDITAVDAGVTWQLLTEWTVRALGEYGGEDRHAMSSTELLSHTHTTGNVFAAAAGGSNVRANTGTSTVSGSAGGNAALNIVQPYLTANVFIKT